MQSGCRGDCCQQMYSAVTNQTSKLYLTMNNDLWKLHFPNECPLSRRRIPRGTTDGKVLVQHTDGLKICGWIWTPCTRAKSKSTAYCPIHTDRQRWDEHKDKGRHCANTHKLNRLIYYPAMSDIFSFPQRIALSFDFPFYGHHLRQIIVATGGEFHFTLLDIIAALIYFALPIRRSNVCQRAEGDSVLPWGNIPSIPGDNKSG